ncbi:MAG: hypothetical protein PHV73_01785 [Eubacteriales bacterium]|nr:hypothetical protein [Eubacteriales bacterium]
MDIRNNQCIMETNTPKKFSVNISFEEIRLPPFEDILILGRKCPQGKIGVYKSFQLLVPDEYEVFEIQDSEIEAVFINKRILRKISSSKVLEIMEQKVFPYVSENEIIKVDFKLRIIYDLIEEDFKDGLNTID